MKVQKYMHKYTVSKETSLIKCIRATESPRNKEWGMKESVVFFFIDYSRKSFLAGSRWKKDQRKPSQGLSSAQALRQKRV